MILQDLSEDQFLAEIRSLLPPPSEGTIGIGDDCAVLSDGTLLKTDCIIEGRHYLPDTPPEQVGHKAIARVLSDFAAMGGRPHALLITIGVRKSTPLTYLKSVYQGMQSCAHSHGASIMGGETNSIPETSSPFFSISGTGYTTPHSPILRSGAQLGDYIYVTGTLGNTYHSQHHLLFKPRVTEARWLSHHTRPTAMMDLSDGLATDLPRLTKASQTGYQLTPKTIPLRSGATLTEALTQGEDYELLFTIPPHFATKILTAPFPVIRIGTITRETPHPLHGGWDHLGGYKTPINYSDRR